MVTFRTRTTKKNGLNILTLALLASSLTIGIQYSGWTDKVRIESRVKVGVWKPRLEISKSLDGTFTDPKTGDSLTTPNRTHIAVAASWETTFKMTIKVRNTGGVKVHDITVKDIIENNVAPKDIQPSQGTYTVYSWIKKDDPWNPPSFGFNEITWSQVKQLRWR